MWVAVFCKILSIHIECASLTGIAISHFLLNLKQAQLASSGISSTAGGSISNLRFASRVVGNLGASLDHGFTDDGLDLEEELEGNEGQEEEGLELDALSGVGQNGEAGAANTEDEIMEVPRITV